MVTPAAVDAPPSLRIGVLALQGDHAAHRLATLRAARAEKRACEAMEVRRPADLEGLDGLILPGGESTTLLKLLEIEDLGLAISRFVTEQGGVLFATCAGAILCARTVTNPAQSSLGLIDASIERNAFGRQCESFTALVQPEADSGLGDEPLAAFFIRAPRFRELGPGVSVLARHEGEPVLVRQGRVLAGTFHPELTDDTRIHALFLRAASSRHAELRPVGA